MTSFSTTVFISHNYNILMQHTSSSKFSKICFHGLFVKEVILQQHLSQGYPLQKETFTLISE